MYREAIRLDDTNSAAYGLLGEALADMGDFEGAVNAMRKALRLNPKSSELYSALGKVYTGWGKPEELSVLIPGHTSSILIMSTCW
ncbi:tetratricopeptide repeat protein [Methanocella arvoryzae]|nr:tetratricopeptide repeat protein [Methanocella arvoryzae]